jgi:hypothetical protein
MRTRFIIGLAVMSIWMLGGQLMFAQQTSDKAHAERAKRLTSAKVSLEEGLTARVREGTPISGKFEMEEGQLQLSIYTMKGHVCSEVIVDHTTAYVTKVEPITSGEDFTAATAQRVAMVTAKKSLQTVVDAAVKTHAGTRAVSVVPVLKGEQAVADITLVKDGALVMVSDSLE